MKIPFCRRQFFLLLFLIPNAFLLKGQTPGFIVRPAAGPGPAQLNPNSNSWTSTSATGFVSNDISESEIPYKVIPPIMPEPTGDLATGPNGGYSDIVKFVDNSGCYVYYDGTNLLFRLRIGGIVSGAKAYNILFDTDMRLGAGGSSPDPNFVAATNSGNGNPGFEWEVALETGTNGRVAVYNVDGIINPSATHTFSLATHHLISAALTRESGNADYFYDFFVPASMLGITPTTPFRIVVTTNTNPGSAFQGTRSDIYGLNDALFPNTTDAWEYAGNNTPGFTLNDVGNSGSGPGNVCTAAPVLHEGIASGSNVSVSGSWTRLDPSKPATATIHIYKNGTLQGTTTCNTGGNWNFTVPVIATGDVIAARAQSAGESLCLLSNSVAATNCIPSSISSNTGAAVTCISNKGIQGTKQANDRIRIYVFNSNGTISLFADDATTTYRVTYSETSNPAGTTWEYHGANNGGPSNACNGAANDMSSGSYAITVTEPGKCESPFAFPASFCFGVSPTATPTITQTLLYPTSTLISGTAAANASVRLFVNGFVVATTTASGAGAYSFANPVLQVGDVVSVRAQGAGLCVSAELSRTVTCFSSAPRINTDAQGNLPAGATTIAGTSTEPNGTTILVFQTPATLLATTTVTNGAWSATVSPLVNGNTYYATAQNGSCTVSPNSSNATARTVTSVCPDITGTYLEGNSNVSGTLPASFTGTIFVYQDGGLIGSTAVTAATTWSVSISVNNPLYAGGVLTVGIQVTGGTLKTDCATTSTVGCSAPATPTVSPLFSSISVGQSVTYTVSGTENNVLYSVYDAGSGTSYASSSFGNGGDQQFTTQVFITPGTYNITVAADKLSGSSCLSTRSASIFVAGTLPVSWLTFTVQKQGSAARLYWKTGSEQNSRLFEVQHSADGNSWKNLGELDAAGNSAVENNYQFLHQQPVNGVNYYRIRQVDQDGRSQYSKVISLIMGGGKPVLVYPNPVTDGRINLQLEEPRIMQVFNAAGQEIIRQSLTPGAHSLNLQPHARGLYLLKLGEQTFRILYK